MDVFRIPDSSAEEVVGDDQNLHAPFRMAWVDASLQLLEILIVKHNINRFHGMWSCANSVHSVILMYLSYK